MMTDARLPVVLLTGFLGSGKTTLLNRLLRDPALSDSVVIVNEFGEIPLDHLLIAGVSENIRLLDTGCVCCSVRGDLIDTLADLRARRERGEFRFSRAFIETSGLVDPVPVFHSFAADPALTGDWRLAAGVTTVDAVNGASTLERHDQARRQVALADVIVATKSDIAAPGQAQRTATAARRLNPHARWVAADDATLGDLLAAADLATGSASSPTEPDHVHDDHEHDHRASIQSRSIRLAAPVAEAALARWIDLLTALRGERLLRLKGLVATREDPERPLLVQAVQHVVHPVERLEGWPDDDRQSRIVLIGEDLDFDTIERTLRHHVDVEAVLSSA